ncbi:DUF3800 domain-containing protein [Neisseria flavescens]|jgi:putative prophage protein|uniref:DUF3800 domain-containing protein n=1 Tax=Neisseria flavescens TaxID=484 RepID=UPI00352E953D|nr:DUF3800 domain-containing protein [Candidatus Saccharibacteria bacterium]
MKIYIDESGNSGDLVQRKIDLTFSNQNIFTLSAVKIPEDVYSKLEKEFIPELKKKYKIQSGEIKSSNLFDKKPKVILEIVDFIKDNNIDYFIEITDKKYYICNSMVIYQVIPPYFISREELNGERKVLREIYMDIFIRNIGESEYQCFFEACQNINEESLLNSFHTLKKFFSEKIKEEKDLYLKIIYQCIVNDIGISIEDYFDIKDKEGLDNAVRKFLPIPDENKKGQLIYLLPQISSLTNLVARVNYFNGNLEDINFIHDQQVHFDNILSYNVEKMLDVGETGYKFTNSNFNIEKPVDITFDADSKDNVGIQIADILSGFTMRYMQKRFKNEDMDSIYHEIFENIEYNKNLSTINYMIGISGFVKLNKRYTRSIEISDEAKNMENEYIQYLVFQHMKNEMFNLTYR